MPDIDDEIEQVREHRKEKSENPGLYLAKKELDKIPFVGTAIDYIRGKEKDEKEEWFDNAILNILKRHDVSIEEIKAELETGNIKRLISVAVEEIYWGASTKKVSRFAAIIADAIEHATEEPEFEDAAFFIRAIDELTEDDIRALHHLYKYQHDLVLENHVIDYNKLTEQKRIESVLRNVGDLKMQMNEFYARCARLVGYGLALPLERNTKFDPSEYMFAITLLGTRLVEMLTDTEAH